MLKRFLLILIPVVILAAWLLSRRGEVPQVAFARVARETLVSTLNTNGKVEPIEWSAIRSETSGAVDKVNVVKGQMVAKGQLLVELDAGQARGELASAQAKIAQANAERQVLSSGGRSTEIAEIESGLVAARASLANAKRELEATERLVAKQAATTSDLNTAREAVQRLELQMQSYERRRSSLVAPTDRTIADARVRDMQALADAATRRIELSQIRSPLAGTLYQFDIRPGSYLNPGDLVGSVGRLDKVRVIVYVDEPDLGRVAKDMAVTISWDALPGRHWKGVVEKTPTQIVPLGTRQVGEVNCIIDNPEGTLIPGTNINAEITSQVVDNALTIPKEAMRREGPQTGVFKLDGERIVWQTVKTGATSVNRIQVVEGLTDKDAVALPVDRPLTSNMVVKPQFP
ncbi:MAG: efflux RND transporter periplasmic adaptor subunit [Bryobacteraceae bacterium]